MLLFACAACGLVLGVVGRTVLLVQEQKALIARLEGSGIVAYLRDEQGLVPVALTDVSPIRDVRARIASVRCERSVERPELLAVLSQLESLESAELYTTELSTDDMRFIASLPRLRSLRLYRTRVSRDGIAALSVAPRLEELELGGPEFDNDSFHGVASLINLRELCLFDASITGKMGRHLVNCESLEEFTIMRGPDDGDDWLHSLTTAQHLQHIRMVKPVTDSGAEAVPLFPNLRNLELHCAAGVSEDGLCSIALSRTLRRLMLREATPTVKALKAISQMDKLENLDCESVGIDDEMVSHLVAMKSLQRIRLRHSKMSDVGLRALGEVPSLKTIIAGPMISQEGVRELKKTRPDVYVLILK